MLEALLWAPLRGVSVILYVVENTSSGRLSAYLKQTL